MKRTALLLLVAACGHAEHVDVFDEGLLLSDQPGLALAGGLGSQVGEDLAIGDLDGDGQGDLILVDREYQRATDEHQRGAVHIVYGDASWSPLIAATDNTLELPDLGYGHGLVVSFAGDVDGDGFGDFIVGRERGVKCAFPDLPISDDERYGEVYVIYGGPRLSGTRPIANHAARLIDTTPCTAAGAYVAGGADLDGDGLDDLAIVSGPRLNSAEVPGADRLYVIYGAAQRLSGTLELPTRADLMITTSTDSSNLAGLEAVGDLDGDGFGEFAVGEYDNAAPEIRNEWMSVVRGYHQRRLGENSLADIATRLTGDVLMVEFNGVGDLDGDGFDELAVTSPSDPVLFSLFYGRADLLDADFDTNEAAARLIGSTGWNSKSIDGGDVDGDGHGDLAIGDIGLFSHRGGAYVLSGSAARFSGDILLDDVAAVYAGNAYAEDGAVDFAGMSLGMGDFDGDGLADVAVGAPNNHVGGDTHRGHVYLLDGGAL